MIACDHPVVSWGFGVVFGWQIEQIYPCTFLFDRYRHWQLQRVRLRLSTAGMSITAPVLWLSASQPVPSLRQALNDSERPRCVPKNDLMMAIRQIDEAVPYVPTLHHLRGNYARTSAIGLIKHHSQLLCCSTMICACKS